MTRRWIAALVGLAMVLVGLTIGAANAYLNPTRAESAFFDGTSDQEAIESYIRAMQVGYVFYSLLPWLATATLIAALMALALAARRAQLAGSASATASREASRS